MARTLRRRARLGRHVLVTLLSTCLFISACGGSPTAPSNPEPTTLTFDFSDIAVSSEIFFLAVFRLDVAASTVITVGWTPAAADVDIALIRGDCITEVGCDVDNPDVIDFALGFSNPETISRQLTSDTYTVLVENLGPGAVSGTVTVVLTP